MFSTKGPSVKDEMAVPYDNVTHLAYHLGAVQADLAFTWRQERLYILRLLSVLCIVVDAEDLYPLAIIKVSVTVGE